MSTVSSGKFFKMLNNVARLTVKRPELILVAVILSVIVMMILPLPTALVDSLIAINICISILLIMLSMYLPGPLAFTTFPAVLLITTLYRLALSISTTRLILLQADAGYIVEAFGNFVVEGSMAVGLVIFFILAVVQFLVISKGAERVAEVAARFTLDGMPGKQMSIDGDMRAGVIDAEVAKQRRADLSRESQLFGAMDGSMKFVKGDAIAGLLIVVINLIGGFAIGMLEHGMSAAESIKIYGVLTIGDGLVTQIPALLNALAAGLLITRVSSGLQESKNLGKDVVAQMTAEPVAWLIASVAMFGFALLPGMPTLSFIAASLVTASVGAHRLYKKQKERDTEDALSQAKNKVEDLADNTKDIQNFALSPLYLLQFSTEVQHYPEVESFIQRIRIVRNNIVRRQGLSLPPLEINFIKELKPHEYRFCVYDVPIIYGSFRFDAVLVQLSEDKALPELTETLVAGEPKYGEMGWGWAPIADRDKLEAAGVYVLAAEEFAAVRMETAFLKTGPKFTGIQETQALVKLLEQSLAELAKELQRVLPLSRFAMVLQILSAERISLKNLRPIAESLVEYAPQERDPAALSDYVRIAIREQICHTYAQNDVIHVYLLTSELEELLRTSIRQMPNGGYLSLEPDALAKLIEVLSSSFTQTFRHDKDTDTTALMSGCNAVLLVAQDIRRHLRQLIEEELPHIAVLSFPEIVPTMGLQVLGRIDLPGS